MLLYIFIILFLIPGLVFSVDPAAFTDDVLGLIVFKAGITDPDSKLASWSEDDADNHCNWKGIKCDPKSKRVTEFSSDCFAGNEQPHWLNPPFSWYMLNIGKGEIPNVFASSYALTWLSLRKNNFSGQLPENIRNCWLLESVDLSDNALTGGLPDSMQKLGSCSYLNLRGNMLTGKAQDWIGDMKRLEILDLSGNDLSGQVPDSIGKLQFLKEANLSKNWFTGGLPGSLLNCVNLSVVDVSQNRFNGNLPSWIFRSGLVRAFLSRNRFTGSIEPSLISAASSSYQSLQVLDLSSNALSGEIPSSIGNFTRLQIFNVSNNSLSGGIPKTLFGRLNQPRVLDLSHNLINGSIPSEIGKAVMLQELNLEGNLLSGVIPTDIQTCSSLTSLVLSQNRLTGRIPFALAKLTNLEIVDLSFNNISGTLPRELSGLTRLISFNVSHNHLQGQLRVGGFFNTIPLSEVTQNPKLVSCLVAIGAAVFIALGVVTITFVNLLVRSSPSRWHADVSFSRGDEFTLSYGGTGEASYGKLIMFSGNADFGSGTDEPLLNEGSELGRGLFGSVYRCEFSDGRSVAIKKLKFSGSIKSGEDFEREVKGLAEAKHPNLVPIEGYYWTPTLHLIISEYVTGGSLYKRLHEDGAVLSWTQRFRIILGVAKGLAHLHRMGLIHYDIKSSNVLIDDRWSGGEPKLGDFGLARLLPVVDRYTLSSKVQSALGYVGPEFGCHGVKITEKLDVYGFGALTLEVVSGRRPAEYGEDDVFVLCDYVKGALERGNVGEECVDKRLEGVFAVEEAIPVIKLGLICASQVPSSRPDMEEVVRILELIQCSSAESHGGGGGDDLE
ncbi:unnamed protein product [Cuscuta campestris]|uniref:Protein kinase domain-containing protein n=1 Tax=Cuscuta campestris TaxID=132261 RepID=A0A484MLC6_9ASTE|nr:unnamed protein product [Cuscuta campestris]